MKRLPRLRFRRATVVRGWLIFAAAWLTLGVPLSTSVPAQEDRSDRGRRGWRREGGPDRQPRPEGERRRSREEREQRREERAAATTSTTSAAAATTNSFGTVSDSDRMRKWASDTVARHDANGDKILEGDELSKLGQSSRGADSNGDGKITVDELYQFSSKGSSTASTSSTAKPATTTPTVPSTARSEPADPKQRTITNDKRKSYRFKSTKDRIDNWRFSSRDANGDGQVSMSEYSRTWTDRTASEFMRYDKNNDGMITAKESP